MPDSGAPGLRPGTTHGLPGILGTLARISAAAGEIGTMRGPVGAALTVGFLALVLAFTR